MIGLLAPHAAHATEVGNGRIFGLGVAAGSPTSIVAKLFDGPGTAWDAGVSFARYGYGRCWNGNRYVRCGDDFGHLGINVDYLWQENIIHARNTLDWHIGVGGRLWLIDDGPDNDDDLALGVRMPLGLDLMFSRPSFLELFLEVAPVFYVIPGTGLDFELALGVRFYF